MIYAAQSCGFYFFVYQEYPLKFKTTAFALALLATGCEDTTPARISHFPVPDVTYTRDAIPLVPFVANASGEMLTELKVAVAASPAGVVSVDGDFVECVGSGDAILTLAGGGLSTSIPMKCRLVAKVKATPERLSLVVGTDPTVVKITAIDDTGKSMTDVPISLVSSSPEAVVVRNGKLVAVAVGRATVEARAGSASATIEVEAIEKIKSDGLVLEDGASVTYTLDRGSYVVEVNVKSGDTNFGVKASWVGENCRAQPEAKSFKTKCRVNDTASLVVENPTAFGLGPAATGNIAIYRGPL